MIVRSWSARATAKGALAYREHLAAVVVPSLRALAGFAGAVLLTRTVAGDVEVVVQTRWTSLVAIRAFAGADLERAVVAEEARRVLSTWDARVEHFDALDISAAGADAPVAPGHVAAVRQFNRVYTAEIGALDERHLESSFSLSQVRILYELAHRESATATELASALRLDAGYMSRMVARFTTLRLVARRTSKQDARLRVLALTALGRKTFADLDHRASEQIRRLLSRVSPSEQQRIVDAMGTIRGLLVPAPRPAYTLRSHRPGDLGWIVEQHGELYAREYGWNQEFEGLVARIVGELASDFDRERERVWIAESEGQRVGCIMVVEKSSTVAQLRLLLVGPNTRGMGIGARLVDECVRFARAAGYKKLTLWTQSVLHAARTLYQRAGFELVREAPHHSFGHDLIEQVWELRLG